jgi:hypothetical protein
MIDALWITISVSWHLDQSLEVQKEDLRSAPLKGED